MLAKFNIYQKHVMQITRGLYTNITLLLIRVKRITERNCLCVNCFPSSGKASLSSLFAWHILRARVFVYMSISPRCVGRFAEGSCVDSTVDFRKIGIGSANPLFCSKTKLAKSLYLKLCHE